MQSSYYIEIIATSLREGGFINLSTKMLTIVKNNLELLSKFLNNLTTSSDNMKSRGKYPKVLPTSLKMPDNCRVMSVNCLTMTENYQKCQNDPIDRKWGTCILSPSRITAQTSFICIENQFL